MQSRLLGYTNHPWVTLVWLKRVSLSPGQQSFSCSVLVYFYSPTSPLLSSTPWWGLLQLPARFQQTSSALLLENLLLPLFDLCPEGLKPSLWMCLRSCSAPEGDKESIFITAVELRKSFSKAMWKLVAEFVQNWPSRLCPVGQSWVRPSFWVCTGSSVYFVTSQYCVAQIPLCAFFHPLLHHFPGSLHCWALSFACPALSITLKLLSLPEESVCSHWNTHHSC